MIAPATTAPSQSGVTSSIATMVASTVATVSQASRDSSNRLTYRGRSATTAASDRAPALPDRTSASTRALDTVPSGESAAANSPASGTSSTASTICQATEDVMG